MNSASFGSLISTQVRLRTATRIAMYEARCFQLFSDKKEPPTLRSAPVRRGLVYEPLRVRSSHSDSCRCEGRVAAPYPGPSVHVCHDPRHCVSRIQKSLLLATDAPSAQPCNQRAAMLTKTCMGKPRVLPLQSDGCWRLKAGGTCQHIMWSRFFISQRSTIIRQLNNQRPTCFRHCRGSSRS